MRPVQYNTNLKMVDLPEGHSGEGFFATSLNNVIGLARKNSIWPYLLLPLVVVLNLWLLWLPTMI